MRDAIVGICRFSFLGWDDWVGGRFAWQRTPARLEKKRAQLYADDRLATRFVAFEQLFLPSIRAQTDTDFALWILTSPGLPAQWMERLRDLCAGIAQIRIIVSAEVEIEAALRRPLRRAADANGGPVLQFRIDDDDALSRHYVARLRREARRFDDMPRFAISFPRGLVIRRYGDEPVSFWRAHQPFVSAGAALRLANPGKSIFAFRHRLIPQDISSFTCNEGLNFVALRWFAGDTAEEYPKEWPRGLTEIGRDAFAEQAEADFPFLRDQDFDLVTRPQGAARPGRPPA